MERLSLVFVCIFMIAAVRATPTTPPYSGAPVLSESECHEIAARETCSRIFINAIDGRDTLEKSFQHYCSAIPGFGPCLEDNKADYMLLTGCIRGEPGILEEFEQIMSLEEMWNTSMNFLYTANDIVCSRTDEIIDIIRCANKHERKFGNQMMACFLQNQGPFATLITRGPDEFEIGDTSAFCGSLYGLASCVKDSVEKTCETDVTDILDTIYNDVIVGVIGDGIGCEDEHNPLLSFVRSVRDKFKR